MIGEVVYQALITADDFKEAIRVLRIDGNMKFIDNASSLNENECTFINSENCLWAKGGAVKSYVSIPIANARVGDVFEVEYEYKNISGKVKNSFVYTTSSNPYDASNYTAMQVNTTQKSNEWNVEKVTFIWNHSDRETGRIDVGLFTGEVGEFKLRNVKVKQTKAISNYTPEVRKLAIKRTETGFIEDSDYVTDGCTFTETSNSVQINFNNPFNERPFDKKPIVLATLDGYGYDQIRNVKIRSISNNGFHVMVYDANGNKVAPSSYPEGMLIWIYATK